MALAGTLFLSSCATEPCADVDCGTFGDCFTVGEEGVCLCTTGYEQNEAGLCEIRSADKFTGTYDVTEVCSDNFGPGTTEYTYETTVGASDTAVTVIFFDNLGDLVLVGDDGNGNEVELCRPEVFAIVAEDAFSIQGFEDGVTYCADQGQDVMFSGYKFVPVDGNTPLGGTISEDETTINLAFRVEFSADFDGDGTAEDFFFSCTSVLTKK
jgi:hypothetical protein